MLTIVGKSPCLFKYRETVVVAISYTLISSENRDAHGVWAVSSPAIVLLRGQFSRKILDFARSDRFGPVEGSREGQL